MGRGYLNRPELTADHFVPDPFSGREGDRLYRTGDRCRWLADGNIEYLGRLDEQVKIRGFRVELGEIEGVLKQHSGVREAAVIAIESAQGGKRLAAYVVPHLGAEVSRERVAEFSPTAVAAVHGSGFLRAVGSVAAVAQRQAGSPALPAPEGEEASLAYVAPRNATEQQLAEIWQELLELERVGIHDNFFDLGGHSLLAVRLTSRIRSTFSIEMPLLTLFSSPTLEGLAERIEEYRASGRTVELPSIRPVGARRPPADVVWPGGLVGDQPTRRRLVAVCDVPGGAECEVPWTCPRWNEPSTRSCVATSRCAPRSQKSRAVRYRLLPLMHPAIAGGRSKRTAG